jgi:hypothetical protein
MSDEVRDIDPVVPAAQPGAPVEPKAEDKTTEATPPADEQTAELPENSASDEATAPETGEPSSEDEDETDGEKPKKLSRSQRERRAKVRALERAEFAEREAAELRRQLAERSKPGAQQSSDPEPRLEDYQNTIDPAGFHKLAHDNWKLRQADKTAVEERQQSESSRRQSEIRRELAEAHLDREDEARERIPDYDNVLRASRVELSEPVTDLLIRSDKSALLAYHLAKNESTLRELNQMSPIEAARQIGRLEARLSLPQAKKTTQAPPPLRPPSGGGASPPTDIRKLADSEDITAYAKARDAKKGGA